MTKKEKAIELHDKKYNCAQAVACVFSGEIEVSERLLFKTAEGFGRGMGDMCGTCGALSGAVLLAGLKESDGNTAEPGSKGKTYKVVEEMRKVFEQKTGGIVCKDLKGIETGKMLCSCPDCIRAGIEVVEEVLKL